MEEIMLRKFKKENSEIYLEYLESCKANNWDTWNTTYKTYINNFKLFLIWLEDTYKNKALLGKDTLKDMPSIIEKYRNYCRSKGNSKRTLMNKVTAISSFYSWCVKKLLFKC